MTYEECRLKLEDIFGEEVIISKCVKDVDYFLGGPIYWRICRISNEKPYEYEQGFYGCEGLEESERKEILTMLLELAGTPLDERVEQQKYYLKHKYLEMEKYNYLNYCILDPELFLSTTDNGERYRTKFTIEEIEKMKVELNTDFKDFEIIKVED